MADGAGRVADFSKTYGQRAHQNQRIGLSPQSIPRLEEVEEMIKHGQKMLSALVNMRDLVYNHQQASLAEPSREAHYRPVNGYDPEGHQNAFHEDPKANAAFSGMDPNKRHKRGVSYTFSNNETLSHD
jgi:glutamate--cysteine ligase catalytic subunit